MDTKELGKLAVKIGRIKEGEVQIVVELMEYEHDVVVSKSTLKKVTGFINALSFTTQHGSLHSNHDNVLGIIILLPAILQASQFANNYR